MATHTVYFQLTNESFQSGIQNTTVIFTEHKQPQQLTYNPLIEVGQSTTLGPFYRTGDEPADPVSIQVQVVDGDGTHWTTAATPVYVAGSEGYTTCVLQLNYEGDDNAWVEFVSDWEFGTKEKKLPLIIG